MKFIISTIILLLQLQVVMAVPNNKKTKHTSNTDWQGIMQAQQVLQSSKKGTSAMKRLIGNSYRANGDLVDSNHYYYSKGRGSNLLGANTYGDSYSPTATDLRLDLLCDSSINWHVNFNNDFERSIIKQYTYDMDNKVSKLDYVLPYLSRANNSYNMQGLLSKVVSSDTFGSTPLQAKTENHIVYDGQGKRILDSFYSLQSGQSTYKREMAYDANGNRLELKAYGKDLNNNWVNNYTTTYTYDVQNRLVTSVSEGLINGNNQKFNMDSFSYSGSSTFPVYHVSYYWDNNNNQWVNDELLTYVLNSNGIPSSYYIINWNATNSAWDTVERDDYTFDPSGKYIMKINGYQYQGGGVFSTTPYDQTTMYMEEYYPENVVNTGNDVEVNIYPNPAANSLTVDTKDIAATIDIYNVSGQKVYTSDIHHTQTVDISNLATGNYMTNITDNTGRIIHSKMLSKL